MLLSQQEAEAQDGASAQKCHSVTSAHLPLAKTSQMAKPKDNGARMCINLPPVRQGKSHDHGKHVLLQRENGGLGTISQYLMFSYKHLSSVPCWQSKSKSQNHKQHQVLKTRAKSLNRRTTFQKHTHRQQEWARPQKCHVNDSARKSEQRFSLRCGVSETAVFTPPSDSHRICISP